MRRIKALNKHILLITIALSMHSCDIIRLLNVHESRDEKTNEIEQFLKKKNYCFDYNFCSVDSSYSSFSDERNNIYITNSAFISAIQLRVYDKFGNLYSAYSQCGGDFKKSKNIKSVPPHLNPNPFLNTKIRLLDELALLEISDEQRREIIKKSETYPYTFIVHYTIWTNYFSENVLEDISRLKKKHPEEMMVILVNVAKDI